MYMLDHASGIQSTVMQKIVFIENYLHDCIVCMTYHKAFKSFMLSHTCLIFMNTEDIVRTGCIIIIRWWNPSRTVVHACNYV